MLLIQGEGGSAGDFIDFGVDLAVTAKMSLNLIPVIGPKLYWSTVAQLADNRNIKDPLLMAVRMVGQFGIEWLTEQIFSDTFIAGIFELQKGTAKGIGSFINGNRYGD